MALQNNAMVGGIVTVVLGSVAFGGSGSDGGGF
jgi:hypothetical protein